MLNLDGVTDAWRIGLNRIYETVAPRQQPVAHIVETGAPNDPLSAKLHDAFSAALENRHPVASGVLNIRGMSGRKYRALINKLIASLDGGAYLEVGIWLGSTLCAAIAGNDVTALGIDNWSKFEGPRERFFRTLRRFQGPGSRVTVIERDFRDIDFAAIGCFDVYFFDGPHGEQDQYDGVARALPALAGDFILIVDDWNRAPVRTGTKRAIADLNLRVNYAIELRTTLDETDPAVVHETSDWHNGYFLASLSKTGDP